MQIQEIGYTTGMSLSRRLQRAIVIGFHFLLLTTPFVFTWTNEELFEFNKMLLVYAGTIVIGGLWAARMVLEKRSLFKRTPLDWVIGAFVISQFLSTLFSIHPRTSWLGYYTRFHGGLLSTLSYVTLYYAVVNNFTKKQVVALVGTILIAALGVSAYSLPEHWGHSPSCWLISNGQHFDVSCWVQDVQNRIFGSFGQPNWLAAYVLMIVPLGLTVAVSSVTPALTILGGGAAFLSGLTLLFTKSRSGFLGVIASLVVVAGGIGIALLADLYGQWRRQLSPKKNTKNPPTSSLNAFWTYLKSHGGHWFNRSQWLTLAGLSLVLVLVAFVFGTPFTPSLSALLPAQSPTTPVAVPPPSSGGTDSGEIRKIVWEGALKVWQRYPLLGSGVETFGYSYYQDRPMAHNHVSEWDFLYNKAHNEFLNFLATTGIVGLVTYVALLVWFGIWILKQVISDQPTTTKLILSGIIASVVGLSVSNFFGFSTVMVTLLWFVLMGVAVVLSSKVLPTSADSRTAPRSTLSPPPTSRWDLPQLIGLAVVASAAVYGLMRVTTWWLADFYFTQGKHAYESGDMFKANEHLQRAVTLSPQEALFHDELASLYANAAVAAAQNDKMEDAQQLATASLAASDTALTLNPRHLNFYKTRARVFIVLGQLNPSFLEEALKTLQVALTLAPTDPKLLYNQALVELSLNQPEIARTHLEETLQMKPDYHSARYELAQLYAKTGQLEAARVEYQKLTIVAPDDPTLAERLRTVEASLSAETLDSSPPPAPRAR